MQLLEHQAEFIDSEFIHTGIVGGFRSGKSQAGVIKTCLKKIKYPGVDVAYYLPTYGLIKDIAYPKFSSILEAFNIKYVLNKTDHEFITPYGRIILRSMDNPDTIIGYEVGYSLLDEADILSIQHMNDVFVKVVARLSIPLPDGKPNCLDFVSTPEGFKFMYEFFVKKPNANKKLIKAKTKNNPFISESYIETLRMSYTEQQLEAYLNGEFVNLNSGSVYFNYDRSLNHTDLEVKDSDILHIGMDFNITNMSAVIHIVNDGFKYAVSELVGVYDTLSMAKLIVEKYPKNKIIIYPDASGQNRKTSGKSDIEILRDFGFQIRVNLKNGLVRDRVNAMNTAFLNAKNERVYFINSNQCPEYADSLMQISYKGGIPDKTSGHDHVTDAGGYFIVNQPKVISGSSSY